MRKLKRYLLVHLAKSLAIAIPVGLIGFGAAGLTDLNQVVGSLAPAVTTFTVYWAARGKAIKAALDSVKVPSAGDVVGDLFEDDDGS